MWHLLGKQMASTQFSGTGSKLPAYTIFQQVERFISLLTNV